VPVTVLDFGGAAVGDTDAVASVAATIVAEHARGVNVVALVPPYGQAARELSRLVAAVSSTPHPRELDLLGSSGAAMAAALCAMAVHRRGCRAISLEGAQAGVLTDDTHTRARVLAVRTDRVLAELRLHGIVLLSAIHGVARDTGEVTTLEPGGHEIVARALAEALATSGCVVESRALAAA
jgi:aspartate kinase